MVVALSIHIPQGKCGLGINNMKNEALLCQVAMEIWFELEAEDLYYRIKAQIYGIEANEWLTKKLQR